MVGNSAHDMIWLCDDLALLSCHGLDDKLYCCPHPYVFAESSDQPLYVSHQGRIDDKPMTSRKSFITKPISEAKTSETEIECIVQPRRPRLAFLSRMYYTDSLQAPAAPCPSSSCTPDTQLLHQRAPVRQYHQPPRQR